MRCLRKIAALALLAAIAPLARAQVLDLIPSDSLAVLRVRNLEQVNTKASKFFTDLGVAAMKPELADPLGTALSKHKITAGLNKGGDFAVAMLAGTKGDSKEPQGLILVPVSDYAAFIGNFKEAKTDAGITEAKLFGEGDTSYIADWGKYAAISNDKTALAAKGKGVKPTGAIAKEVNEKDLVIWANVAAIRERVLPEMTKARDKALAEMDDHDAPPEAKQYIPIAKAAVTQIFGAAEAFLRDSDNSTLAFNLNDSGVTVTAMANFIPDSYLGKFASSFKGSSEPLLAGLPKAKYLFYAGYVLSSDGNAGKVFNDFTGPIMAAMGEGKENPAITKMIASSSKIFGAIKSGAGGMIAPSGPIGQTSLIQYAGLARGDAKAIAEASKDAMQAQVEMMNAAKAAEEKKPAEGEKKPDAASAPAAAGMSMAVTPAAKTIDGVVFDQYTMKLTGEPKDAMEAQMMQAMTIMYGPSGMTTYAAVATPDTYLATMGLNDQQMTDFVGAVKKNENALGTLPYVKEVTSQLPPSPVFVGYVAVDEIINTGCGYAKQMGIPVNVQLPPDLPPVGFSVAGDTTAVRFDLHVPTRLVQSVTAGIMQMMQQQGGGGGGGGL